LVKTTSFADEFYGFPWDIPWFLMAFPWPGFPQVVLRAVAADRSALLYASPELRRNKVPKVSCHFQ